MDTVPLLQPDHKPSRGILAQIMPADHSTVSAAVYGMNAPVANVAFYNPYCRKELRVFAHGSSISAIQKALPIREHQKVRYLHLYKKCAGQNADL